MTLATSTAVLFLSATHVTAVTATVGGLPYTDFTFDRSGAVRFNGYAPAGTVVTYTAGWPAGAFPAGAKKAVCLQAKGLVDNPRDLRSWALGDESETYMGSTAHADAIAASRWVGRHRLVVLA